MNINDNDELFQSTVQARLRLGPDRIGIKVEVLERTYNNWIEIKSRINDLSSKDFLAIGYYQEAAWFFYKAITAFLNTNEYSGELVEQYPIIAQMIDELADIRANQKYLLPGNSLSAFLRKQEQVKPEAERA